MHGTVPESSYDKAVEDSPLSIVAVTGLLICRSTSHAASGALAGRNEAGFTLLAGVIACISIRAASFRNVNRLTAHHHSIVCRSASCFPCLIPIKIVLTL